MTDALDTAEKRAHEAIKRLTGITARDSVVERRDLLSLAEAAIRALRREAFNAGLERAATVAKGWGCLDANGRKPKECWVWWHADGYPCRETEATAWQGLSKNPPHLGGGYWVLMREVRRPRKGKG